MDDFGGWRSSPPQDPTSGTKAWGQGAGAAGAGQGATGGAAGVGAATGLPGLSRTGRLGGSGRSSRSRSAAATAAFTSASAARQGTTRLPDCHLGMARRIPRLSDLPTNFEVEILRLASC